MVEVHPSHIDALRARVEALESDLQHKREIVSLLLDREARAQARTRLCIEEQGRLRARLLEVTGRAR